MELIIPIQCGNKEANLPIPMTDKVKSDKEGVGWGISWKSTITNEGGVEEFPPPVGIFSCNGDLGDDTAMVSLDENMRGLVGSHLDSIINIRQTLMHSIHLNPNLIQFRSNLNWDGWWIDGGHWGENKMPTSYPKLRLKIQRLPIFVKIITLCIKSHNCGLDKNKFIHGVVWKVSLPKSPATTTTNHSTN